MLCTLLHKSHWWEFPDSLALLCLLVFGMLPPATAIEFSGFNYPRVLIPDLFNSLQVLIIGLLSVLGLRYLDPFLVLQLITDVVTINCPDVVVNILPSHPHLICSYFLAMVKYIVSHGTAQHRVIIV